MESMEDFENPICRLCFNVISDNTFKVIEKTIREALEVILKLNVDENIKSVMCTACSTRLFAAFQFKAYCMDTENSLFPYVNPEDVTRVDLKDIYLKERGKEHLRTMLNDQRICRLCMQKAALGFMSVEDVEIDVIQNCIPEINFNCTKDPIICAACLHLLNSHNNFLKDYSYVEMEIKNAYDTGSPVFIKTEKIEVTYEENNENSGSTLDAQDGSVDDTNQYKSLQNSAGVDSNNYSLYEHGNILSHQASSDVKNCLPSHQLAQEELAEARMHQCDVCDYKTRQKSNLKVHSQRHKYFSATEGFICDSCDYKTMLKSDLKKHELMHKDMSETKVFECDTCDFKCKRKSHLNVHLLIHKSFSETEVFECYTCDYKTKNKSYLKRHLIRHRDISTIKGFQCGICDYKGKRKYDLTSHLIKHRDISEMTLFKCDICDYKTKYKVGLGRHLFLRHQIV